MTRIARAVACLAAGFAACDAAPEAAIEWADTEDGRRRSLTVEGEGTGRFTPVGARRTGISASTAITEEQRLANRTWAHGSGIALGDVDGDGWADVYVTRLDRPNVLYRNLGGWRFEDVTAVSGTALPEVASRGAVLADADGDGDLDLFVSVHGAANRLLENDGEGRFAEAWAGFTGDHGTSTLALADIDSDGDLDAYFANYKTIQGDDLFSPDERNLQGAIREVDGELEVVPPYSDHYRLQRVDGRVRRFELADPDELYRNDGAGRFELVPIDGETFSNADGTPIVETPRAWGLVARFFDADDDGDADLYVANDFGSPDGFWLNVGGRFRAASSLALRTTSASSMGVDFSDVDSDGDTDFVTTEMLAVDPTRRRTQVAGTMVPRTPPGRAGARVPAGRNALQLNRGDGTFAEVGQAAGVHASEWTWGAMFLDVDLDGHQDLLVTNGHAWDPLDGDTQEALRTGRVQVDWRRELGIFPTLELANLAFRNRGDGTFEPAPASWRYGSEPDISHGIAAADLDRDGDRDLVISRLNQPPLVLRNDAAGARVSVRLWGRNGNTQAIGARVELEGGAVGRQTRQVTSGGMYLSGSDPSLSFAMGTSDSATVHVRWPSGGRTSHRVGTNTAIELTAPAPPAGGDAAPGSSEAEESSPWLSPVTTAGRHAESEYDELVRQPLIPLELSRMGPGVTWAELDAGRRVELLVGAGAGSPALRFAPQGDGGFRSRSIGDPPAGDHTTLLSLETGSGRPVVAGVSSWEARSPEEMSRIEPLTRIDGAAEFRAPPTPDATGPLSAADVDGDGHLDLFVGGRVVPGAYPRPASSRVLLWREGTWVEDPEWSAPLRSVGMVSGSAFTDVDLDGDPDLVLAVDWGPVRLFLNRGDRLEEATAAWGLVGLEGRWNGIATGDLDGDGRPDLVVTSWGENASHVPTPGRPTGILAADLDGNGLVDVVEFETDATGAARPIRDYPTLSAALPFIRRAAPTYARFAEATVEDLLGPDPRGSSRVTAETTAHMRFLNRGGTFEGYPLPASVQRAPAFGVVIADFDRDGAEDVFVAQNFFATPQGISRFDAGRGVLLAGDGTGSLRALDARESGIRVYGDARGAAVADYDRDGRWDLAVGQNGAEPTVFRGEGGAPGLRVRLRDEGPNPAAIGARVRVRYDGSESPVREIQAGSGYWSSNGVVQVFGLRGAPRSVHVVWPGGAAEDFPLREGERDVELRRGEGGS